jgi:hypothetical protein
MPGGEHRPGRFTQLDFDSLATVAEDTQAEHGSAVQPIDIQPFSGTRQKFVLKAGGIQYTLDAALSAPSAQEGDETTGDEGTRQDGPRQKVAQPFSGRTFSLVPGGLQYTLDAQFGTGVPDEEADTGQPAERQQLNGHLQLATPPSLFDTLEGLPSDDVAGESSQLVTPIVRNIRLSEPEPDRPTRDFRITDAHQIGAGGLHEKARANLAAIRLLGALCRLGRVSPGV